MTLADIIIWLAMNPNQRTSLRKLKSVFGDCTHNLRHLEQLGLIRHHINPAFETVSFSLVLHDRYSRKPLREAA